MSSTTQRCFEHWTEYKQLDFIDYDKKLVAKPYRWIPEHFPFYWLSTVVVWHGYWFIKRQSNIEILLSVVYECQVLPRQSSKTVSRDSSTLILRVLALRLSLRLYIPNIPFPDLFIFISADRVQYWMASTVHMPKTFRLIQSFLSHRKKKHAFIIIFTL